MNRSGHEARAGDRVTFFIAQQVPTGTIYARKVEIVSDYGMNKMQTYRGLVSTLKDTFGRIEREDMMKEIFFHFSEYKGNSSELFIGANVQFEIENRVSLFLKKKH